MLAGEEALSALFVTPHDRGFVRPKGAPVENGKTGRVAGKAARHRFRHRRRHPPLPTRPKAGHHAHTVAGTSAGLTPHIDEEGWHHALPGINFHLSLKAAPGAGGESVPCDDLSAAIKLWARGQAFGLLCRLPFRFVIEHNPRERYRACGRLIVTDRDSGRALGVPDVGEGEIKPAGRSELSRQNPVPTIQPIATRRAPCLRRPSMLALPSAPPSGAAISSNAQWFHNSCRRLAERQGRMDDAVTILPGGALG